jgi:hypothetical protein
MSMGKAPETGFMLVPDAWFMSSMPAIFICIAWGRQGRARAKRSGTQYGIDFSINSPCRIECTRRTPAAGNTSRANGNGVFS